MNRKTDPDRPVSRVLSLAVVFTAMVGLSSCGGGGGGGGDGGGDRSTIITPPTSHYGAVVPGTRGPDCSSGWGIGVSTGHSSEAAARSAAINECRRAGSTSGCGEGVGTFGSAYTSGSACYAYAYGDGGGSGACGLRDAYGATLTAARTAALSKCQNEFPSCRIEVAECSTSGPADSFFRISRQGSTGGGNTGGGTSGRYFGAIEFSFRGSNCSGGYAVGLATGYSNQSGANSAAIRQCSNSGGRDCRDPIEFGSGYAGNNDCGALAYGETNRSSSGSYQCYGGGGTGGTRAAAESDALSNCRGQGGGYNCSIVTSACSTSGPENSLSRIGSGTTGGGSTSGNRPPVVRGGFQDATLQQGQSTRYSTSNVFQDPDGDRLNITARSNTSYVTASVTGGSLVITGVQAITGAATITVTATDPGGLSASTRFSVRVTAAPRQWGYYAIAGSSCTGNGRYGWSLNSGYSDEASAASALRSACNSGGGCPTGDTFRNSCVGVAVSQGCGYSVRSASSAASARNAAVAALRNQGATGIASVGRCAGSP